ncbi:hypothetical protein EHQ47_19555 [Leptospira bourretii]|uniref:hypothetical protein n=1 Tax=Leptospira bourretii TaxID=2484962 RepID=UPI0010913E51|nr:hypothetical protein [Leptospira bourretii]TGL17393.1 hypothetical protein EHQ47_19555 [Leptospira bourretii]
MLKGEEGKKFATSELKDVQLLFDYLPKKEREAAEKQLKEQGLNPPPYGLSDDPNVASELRKSYERLIVNVVLQERAISGLKKESQTLDTTIKNQTKAITNEVTSLVNSVEKREKEASEVTIVTTDPKSGKIQSIKVDIRDPNISAEHKKLAEKAIYENEQRKVDKELTQALKEFDKTQEKILQNEIFDEAVRLELNQLNTLSGNELLAIRLENPGATLKQLEDIQKQKLKEKIAGNAEHIKELESLQLENRAKQISNMLQMNQHGKINSGVAKQLLSTYEVFQKMDIDKILADVPDSKKATVRASLDLIKNMGSDSDFALKTASALCNVISGWEAAMLAGRKIEPDFAKFYVEQVIKGEITVGTHGGKQAVFYGSGKDYINPSHSLDNVIGRDKNTVLAELNKGPNKVAVVEIDTDATPDGKGNHFILAYQDNNGDWRLQDHTSEIEWRNGGKLESALNQNKITSIRILD